MIDNPASAPVDLSAVEAILRKDLAQGDSTLGAVAPILRHLLNSGDNSIFSEEVLARLRGMMADLARQLLDLLAAARGSESRGNYPEEDLAALTDLLTAQAPLLGHVHAVALEAQLAERLQARQNLDPVLSPLLQALVASANPAVAADAMALVAAQTRFVQSQRRMQLPLAELPGDLLHAALLTMRHFAGTAAQDQDAAAAAEAEVRNHYDESRTRIGQIARIVTGMGAGASAALALSHAGPAIFLTALALAAGQDRDLVILATGEGQIVRFVLSLRAAGLKMQAVEEQLFMLHPDAAMPLQVESIVPERAAALLAQAGLWSAP